MRLQNKIALIGLLASTALIGTGFAAWTFTNAAKTSNSSAEPQIVCAVELNDDFELYNANTDEALGSLYLICDAPADLEGTLGGHGVYWSKTNDSSSWANKVDEVYIKGTLNYDAYDIDELNTVTVTFAKGTDYVLGNGTYITFAEATLPAAAVVAVEDNATVRSANFALPAPSYTGVDTTSFNKVADVANITAGLGTTLTIAYQATITAQTLK